MISKHKNKRSTDSGLNSLRDLEGAHYNLKGDQIRGTFTALWNHIFSVSELDQVIEALIRIRKTVFELQIFPETAKELYRQLVTFCVKSIQSHQKSTVPNESHIKKLEEKIKEIEPYASDPGYFEMLQDQKKQHEDYVQHPKAYLNFVTWMNQFACETLEMGIKDYEKLGMFNAGVAKRYNHQSYRALIEKIIDHDPTFARSIGLIERPDLYENPFPYSYKIISSLDSFEIPVLIYSDVSLSPSEIKKLETVKPAFPVDEFLNPKRSKIKLPDQIVYVSSDNEFSFHNDLLEVDGGGIDSNTVGVTYNDPKDFKLKVHISSGPDTPKTFIHESIHVAFARLKYNAHNVIAFEDGYATKVSGVSSCACSPNLINKINSGGDILRIFESTDTETKYVISPEMIFRIFKYEPKSLHNLFAAIRSGDQRAFKSECRSIKVDRIKNAMRDDYNCETTKNWLIQLNNEQKKLTNHEEEFYGKKRNECQNPKYQEELKMLWCSIMGETHPELRRIEPNTTIPALTYTQSYAPHSSTIPTTTSSGASQHQGVALLIIMGIIIVRFLGKIPLANNKCKNNKPNKSLKEEQRSRLFSDQKREKRKQCSKINTHLSYRCPNK